MITHSYSLGVIDNRFNHLSFFTLGPQAAAFHGVFAVTPHSVGSDLIWL
jgi:hypothetical protein